jgi:hypothetical protein
MSIIRFLVILQLLVPSIVALGIVAASGTSGLSSSGSSSSALQQTGASRSALVTVADGRNRPLVDLGPDDFVIKEAGEPREILDVRPADYPVVVLIDTGAAARGDFEDIRRAVARFIGRLGQRPVAIGALGDPPAMITSFDDDRGRILQRLAGLSTNQSGDSVALAGAALAASTLRETGAAFSAIVVVSASPVDATRRSPEEMIGSILDSGAIVHVIVNRANRANLGAPRGADAGAAGDTEGRSTQMLRTMTEQTHGEFMTIYSSESYPVALDRLSDHLASELLVEYLVPVGSKGSDVQVGVRVLGARVRGLGVRPRE